MYLHEGGKVPDWHSNWFEEEDKMNVYLISDTHFNHENMKTYCDRPDNFTELLIKNWHGTVKPEDMVIHLGDVQIGKKSDWIMPSLPGRKVLIRGNHDRQWSNTRWMKAGFDFSCDSMVFRNVLLTHEPANAVVKSDGYKPYGSLDWGLPEGCILNVHGHLHNIFHGFHRPEIIERDKELLGDDYTRKLKYPWQRLFAVEYTGYRPVEFDKFIANPDKYNARGINVNTEVQTNAGGHGERSVEAKVPADSKPEVGRRSSYSC